MHLDVEVEKKMIKVITESHNGGKGPLCHIRKMKAFINLPNITHPKEKILKNILQSSDYEKEAFLKRETFSYSYCKSRPFIKKENILF